MKQPGNTLRITIHDACGGIQYLPPVFDRLAPFVKHVVAASSNIRVPQQGAGAPECDVVRNLVDICLQHILQGRSSITLSCDFKDVETLPTELRLGFGNSSWSAEQSRSHLLLRRKRLVCDILKRVQTHFSGSMMQSEKLTTLFETIIQTIGSDTQLKAYTLLVEDDTEVTVPSLWDIRRALFPDAKYVALTLQYFELLNDYMCAFVLNRNHLSNSGWIASGECETVKLFHCCCCCCYCYCCYFIKSTGA